MSSVYDKITAAVAQGRKLFALLIDPEKCTPARLETVAAAAAQAQPDLILVGGSQLRHSTEAAIATIKQRCGMPVVLFPGNVEQLASNADALLLLSLLSGRNAEWLVGQQVRAARQIHALGIETIPTGYILIDGGKTSAVQRVSHTQPIAAADTDLAVATALCGQQAGKRLIYLEAGSGAATPVPHETIRAVKQMLHIPLVVGGGIATTEALRCAYAAGADIAVVGNHLETHLDDLQAFADVARSV